MSTIDPTAIDPTKPTTGTALTADVRANEQATRDQLGNAKTDIEGLESGKSDIGHNHDGDYEAAGAIAAHDAAPGAHGGVEAAFAGHDGVGGATHPAAISAGAAGYMTGADKAKLDGISGGAEPNAVDSVHGRTGDVVAQAGDYDGLYALESAENTTAGPLALAVVAALPGTPDANTVYFVTA